MTTRLLKDIKKGLGQITKVIESLSGSITEADIQDSDSDVVLRYKCRYDNCDKTYGHASSRAAHESKEHGGTKPLKRRQDD